MVGFDAGRISGQACSVEAIADLPDLERTPDEGDPSVAYVDEVLGRQQSVEHIVDRNGAG